VEIVRSLIKETGALDKAKEHVRKHIKEAENLIAKTELNNEAKQLYTQLLNYIEESIEWYR
jgi:geranylgeranyl pyrophosphate synthase